MIRRWTDVKDLKNVYLVALREKKTPRNDMINAQYFVCKTAEKAIQIYENFIDDKYLYAQIINRMED